MAAQPTSTNLIIQLLPTTVAEPLVRACDRVYVDLRDEMFRPGKPILSIDFPENGVISILKPVDDSFIEVSTVGREGCVGAALALGVNQVEALAYCQVEGSVLRLSTEQFLKLLEKHPELKRLCHRYAVTQFDQVSRNAACNIVHSVEQRCARWLLLTHDRCNFEKFFLTQEFLAKMLGVSRTGVNFAATTLAKRGFISYVRGKVLVLDRPGLEDISCQCYAATNDYYKATMGNGY